MQALQHYGSLSLFLVLLLDSMGIPLPTEITLVLAGVMLHAGRITWAGAIPAAIVGFTLGCWVSYRLGASVGARLLDKYGRYVGIQPEHRAKAEDWVRRHGVRAVFLGRFIPVVRSLAGYPAGAVGMPLGRYFVGSVLGYSGYVGLNLFLGFKLGKNWRHIISRADRWLWVVLVLAVGYVAVLLWRRSRKRASGRDDSTL